MAVGDAVTIVFSVVYPGMMLPQVWGAPDNRFFRWSDETTARVASNFRPTDTVLFVLLATAIAYEIVP